MRDRVDAVYRDRVQRRLQNPLPTLPGRLVDGPSVFLSHFKWKALNPLSGCWAHSSG